MVTHQIMLIGFYVNVSGVHGDCTRTPSSGDLRVPHSNRQLFKKKLYSTVLYRSFVQRSLSAEFFTM